MTNGDKINLYPKMNEEIVGILRLPPENPMNLYAAELIETLTAKLAEVERERDTAIEDMKCNTKCNICKHFKGTIPCRPDCGLASIHWQWRGAGGGDVE